MKFSKAFAPIASVRTVVLASLIANLGCNLTAADSPEKKEPQRKKVEFSPDIEKKISDFFAKYVEAKRKRWTEVIKAEIEQISNVTQLGPDGVKALELGGQKTIDVCLPDWKEKAEDAWRKMYSQRQGLDFSISQAIDQVIPRMDQVARSDWFGGFVAPLNHKAWDDAVKQTLDASQLSAWEKFSADRRDRLEKVIADFVKIHSGESRARFEMVYSKRAARVKRILMLDKEKAALVDRLVETIAANGADYLDSKMAEGLRKMEESRRSIVLKNGHYDQVPDEEEQAKFQAMWDEGLEKILSRDDVIQLKAKSEDLKKSRVQVMAGVLILELDQKLALSSDQRTRIQPIAERLVGASSSLATGDDEDETEFGFTPGRTVLSLFSGKDCDELNPVLDPLQRQRCQNAYAPKTAAGKVPQSGLQPAQAQNVEPEVEPEESERLLSDFLREKFVAERKRVLDSFDLKIEDVSRVVKLSEHSIERLQAAAHGAAEFSLREWRGGFESNIRSTVEGVEAKDMKRYLAGLQTYQYQRQAVKEPEASGLWGKTIEKEVTPEQLAAWRAENGERDAFRRKAIAAVLLFEFDRRYTLTLAQRDKLMPRVLGIINDYEADVRRMFSYSPATGWYMQPHSMFVPFAGIPEKEMKEILTKEQWDALASAGEFANATNYWGNVERMHQQRMKEQSQ